jgi:23S rRNA C2498 (ribose-2'-O)-methylase RlmM
MKKFFLFLTNVDNEALLKEELQLKMPELKLSFSTKGLVSFTSDEDLTLEKIYKKEIIFTRRIMQFVQKMPILDLKNNYQTLLQQFPQHNVQIYQLASVEQTDLKEFMPLEHREDDDELEYQKTLNFIRINAHEVWLGVSHHHANYFPQNSATPNLTLPDFAPSRAYLKLAEAFELFRPNIEPQDTFIEFGCAPGGASSFILDRGHKLIGIDPAAMSEEFISNKLFHFIHKSVFEVKKEDIPFPVNWVIVDMNLSPGQSINETLRVCTYYKKDIKGFIFTAKMPQVSAIHDLKRYFDKFQKFGCKKIVSAQLPTHRKEFCIFTLNSSK